MGLKIVLIDMTTQVTVPTQGDNPAKPVINPPTSSTFKITHTKLYVPVVTLSTQDDNKLLERQKARFKRTIK